MKKYIVDFHVHTALSPCCSDLMTPRTIVDAAKAVNVNILAISDHNSGNNVAVTEQLAMAAGIKLLYSLELHVQENFHMLTLFDDWDNYQCWLKFVEEARSKTPLEKNIDKAQLIFGEDDEVVGTVIERLNLDTNIPVRVAIERVHELGGICIASHIDRAYDSVLRNCGNDIPADLLFDALEISSATFIADALIKYSKLRIRYPFVTNSDSHILEEFTKGPKNIFYIKEPSIKEIILALNNQDSRRVEFKSREW